LKNFDLNKSHISGDGEYSKKVVDWFYNRFNFKKILITTSCTDALEMAAILINASPEDEIISSSYTFVSTVNAFVLRGLKIVFVDIDPRTMNIDADLIESAITPKTRAIVVVHYAGVSCDMEKIIDIAKRHNLVIVEDAAQGVLAKYKDQYLGSIGNLGTYSFHETKNYTMGEGGALIINDSKYFERAEIIREKGTNRSNFLRGQVDKYTWVDIGSSFLPSDILAAYLFPQLEIADEILENRLSTWNLYFRELSTLTRYIELPFIPDYAQHNAHMFYIKVKDIDERTSLITHLATDEIQAVFHYVPLHTSPAGIKYGRFHGVDRYTSIESEKLLRLPIYYKMNQKDVLRVCRSIKNFYGE
jgi:dTDP-4-amino-4,6-dideoxygalactose transaminase